MLDRLKKVLKTQAGMFYAILIAGVMLLGTSYSIFVLSTSSITTSEILVGNMLYSVSVYEEGSGTPVSNRTVTVPASSSKSYYIVLASVNNTNTNFKLAYNASDSTGLTITASDRTGYDVSGLIGAYSTYGYKRIIKVNVENTGSAKTIEFNAFGGYNFNNVSKVNLGSGFTALNVSNENVSTSKRNLIDQIEKDLNCVATENKACLYGPNSNANKIYIKEIDNTDPNDPQEVEVLYYILGVYKLGANDSDKVVKVIRSDVYEESTYTSANVESALSNFHTNVLSDTFEKSQIYETNKFDCTRTNQDITSCASYTAFNSNIGLMSADEYRVINGYLNNTTTTDDHFVLDNVNANILPDAYQEVEYLESTGTQYIDLGIQPTRNKFYSFETEGQLLSNTETYALISVFGSFDFHALYLQVGKASVYGGKVYWQRSGTNYIGTITNEPYKISFFYNNGNYTLNVNGTVETGTLVSDFNIPYNMILFGANGPTPILQGQRIKNFKLYEETDGIIRNMIPCYRKSDSVKGMYDTVNNVFYTNAGTGTFENGPIIKPIKLLDLDDGTTSVNGSTSSYIKPVFYLKNDTEVTGNGTSADPYTISLATTPIAPTQVFKPQYYSWDYGYIGGSLPADIQTDSSELTTNPGYDFYLGLDSEDGETISAAYVCFTKNNTEYCLKGYDTSAYSDNLDVIREAFADIVDTDDCSFDDDRSSCFADGLGAEAILSGIVGEGDGYYAGCTVFDDGSFGCMEG